MRIAQISDFHICGRGNVAYGCVDTAAMLEAAVDAVLALAPAPDCVLATGDLCDSGRTEDYALLDEILSCLPMPVFAIPGNHDRGENLARVLGARHRYLPADGFLHYVIEDFPVRLIGLDSTVPGETYGRLCEARLAWLHERLVEGCGRPTILFIHHPPFPTGIPGMDGISFVDCEALARMVRDHPEIERVVAGHCHRPIAVRWAGTIGFVAPSTAHQVALDLRPDTENRFILEPPGLAVHAWREDTGIVTHLVPIGGFGPAFDVILPPGYPGALTAGPDRNAHDAA